MQINDIIATLSTDKNIFGIVKGDVDVILDDSTSIMIKRNEIPFNYIYWDLIRRDFPEIVIGADLCLSTYSSDGVIDGGTINKLSTTIYRRIVSINRSPAYRSKGLKMILSAANEFVNSVTGYLLKYMESIDIIDYMEIANNPKMVDAKNVPKPYSESDIARIYDVGHELLMDPDIGKVNSLARAYRQKTVKRPQALQTIATRGNVSEINGTVFPNSITGSFTEGLNNPVDLGMESRSAAMAAVYTDSVIALSEYTARRIQLITMVLESIDYGTDCGSTDYIEFHVHDNDLKFLDGMYYLDEKDASLKMIKPTDIDLIDKILKIRWTVGCKHPEPSTVCEVCYGKMSMSMFPTTNIGHYGAAAIDNKRSQKVLSIKHLLKSVSVDSMTIRPIDKKFVSVSDMGVYIQPDFLYGADDVELLIPVGSALVMASLYNNASDIMDSEPGIKKAKLQYTSKKTGKRESHILNLAKKGSELFISEELVAYSRKHGLGYNDSNYTIKLDRWSPNNPIFLGMGRTHTLKEHVDEFINLMVNAGTGTLTTGTPEELMSKLFRLVTSKMDAHFTHVATLVFAITAADPDNGDFRMPKYGTPETRKAVTLAKKISNNSLGTSLGYQGMATTLGDPSNSTPALKDNSPMDILLTPKEVINDVENRRKKTLPKTYNGEDVIKL